MSSIPVHNEGQSVDVSQLMEAVARDPEFNAVIGRVAGRVRLRGMQRADARQEIITRIMALMRTHPERLPASIDERVVATWAKSNLVDALRQGGASIVRQSREAYKMQRIYVAQPGAVVTHVRTTVVEEFQVTRGEREAAVLSADRRRSNDGMDNATPEEREELEVRLRKLPAEQRMVMAALAGGLTLKTIAETMRSPDGKQMTPDTIARLRDAAIESLQKSMGVEKTLKPKRKVKLSTLLSHIEAGKKPAKIVKEMNIKRGQYDRLLGVVAAGLGMPESASTLKVSGKLKEIGSAELGQATARILESFGSLTGNRKSLASQIELT